MSIPRATVGIDAGATLCKVVYPQETLRTELYSSEDLDRVREAVTKHGPDQILVTGGGADRLGEAIAGVSLRRVQEFAAWGRGAPILAARAGLELPERYLLVSLGTGTSALAVDPGGVSRVGGTALGGGTLVGLARLLLGTESFQTLVELAGRGDRRRVDLLVGDIYRTDGTPLPADITAANFGKVASKRPEDLAAAIMGLLGENVALICSGLATRTESELVLYCGSTVAANPVLDAILEQVTRMSGHQSRFLEQGAFCGAVGAAAHAED
jgi:type II pantothenate kinase